MKQGKQAELDRFRVQEHHRKKRLERIVQRWAHLVTRLQAQRRRESLDVQKQKLLHSLRSRRNNTSQYANVAQIVDSIVRHGLNAALIKIVLGFDTVWNKTSDDDKKKVALDAGLNEPIVFGKLKLKLGMLLVRNAAENRYSNLYKKMFGRVAGQAGVDISWRVYDTWKNILPTLAEQKALDGFVVVAGPGWDDRLDRQERAYRNCLTLLVSFAASAHSTNPIFTAALGGGHVVLGEALGGTVMCRCDEQGQLRPCVAEAIDGIYYCHGEFLTHVERCESQRTICNATGDTFVAEYTSSNILSYAGHPECQGMVLRLLIASQMQNSGGDDDDDDDKTISTSDNDREVDGRAAERMVVKVLEFFRQSVEFTKHARHRLLQSRQPRQHHSVSLQHTYVISSFVRGCSNVCDGSLQSIKAAVKAGTDIVQLDVVLTADGYPVVYHHASLLHYTDVHVAAKGEENYWYTIARYKSSRHCAF